MRLGQLARQLEIKPEKIVSYLNDKDITIKKHPNSKVPDELIDDITNNFKPTVEEVKEETQKEEKKAKEQKVLVVKEEVVEEPKAPEHIETVKPEAPQELKIIGKIDLPDKSQINVEVDGVVYDQETLENKKKEELAAERERKAIEKEEKRKEEEERKRIAREKRQLEQERQAMLETEKNNILTLEEERKKEIIIKAQQERERRLEERRKAKQAEHYAQKFSAKAANKKNKKAAPVSEKPIDVPQETTPQAAVEVAEVKETSIIKRFIKWLNT